MKQIFSLFLKYRGIKLSVNGGGTILDTVLFHTHITNNITEVNIMCVKKVFKKVCLSQIRNLFDVFFQMKFRLFKGALRDRVIVNVIYKKFQ